MMLNRHSGFRRFVPIDLVGAATVALCALAAFSFASATRERTSETLPLLQQAVQQSTADLNRLQTSCERRRAQINASESLLEGSGLPESTRIEEFLQMVSKIAEQNQIKVIRHRPLMSVLYPGLKEERCAFEVSGRMANLFAFLQTIEQIPFWADVSFLSIRGNPGADDSSSMASDAKLTFSLFAHLPQDADDRKD